MLYLCPSVPTQPLATAPAKARAMRREELSLLDSMDLTVRVLC